MDDQFGGLPAARNLQNAGLSDLYDIFASDPDNRIFLHRKSPSCPKPHGRRWHSGDVPVRKITDARVVYRLLTGSHSDDYLRHSSQIRFNRPRISKSQGHADMAARKAEPLVKSLRIDAGVMRQQFDQ